MARWCLFGKASQHHSVEITPALQNHIHEERVVGANKMAPFCRTGIRTGMGRVISIAGVKGERRKKEEHA